MKRTIFLWLFSFYLTSSFAQFKAQVDSLMLLLQKEKQDTTKVLLLANIGTSYIFAKPETGLTYVQKGLELSKKIKYKRGEATCLNALGYLNSMMMNKTGALNFYFQALHIFESINDINGEDASYFGVAGNYVDQGDDKEALVYYRKVLRDAESSNNTEVLGSIEANMGSSYFDLNELDSALKYEQNAYELQINTPNKAYDLAILGDIHEAMNNHDVALSFYHMGIPVAITNSDNNALTELYWGISTLFQKRKQYDSSIYYSKKELSVAQESKGAGSIASASHILSGDYKALNNIDSAFKYLELYQVTNDTLNTQDEIKQQQVLAFQEKTRQQEKQAELKAAIEKRNQDIQFAAIAIGVICFIILFLLLSRSIIINANWIRFLGVLALLVTFEFINLIIHPYLSSYTNDSPILMLIALVIISAALIPLHHKLEKWIIEKMVEKNKAIRLAAAKKTIEKLGKKSDNV